MLTNLSISNYALIESLEMTPDPRLNMITGETGAGKSIMLGAVGLLLGNRADVKSLFDEERKCVIEGQFLIEEYGLNDFFDANDLDYERHCIIRREIAPSGKSRAFINDTPVKLEALKTLGKALMDVHSQHDTLLLGANEYQLSLLDAFAQNQEIKTQYSQSYKSFQKAKKSYENISAQAFELKKEAEFNKFLLEELSTLQLKENEQQELEEQQEILDNAEEIKSKIHESLQIFNGEEMGLQNLISQLQQQLNQLSKFGQRFGELKERFQSVAIEAIDIAATLEDEDGKIEVDFDQLETIRERLSKIYHLQQKHGVDSVEALMAIESDLADKVLKVENLDDELEKLKSELEQARKQLFAQGEKLSKSRQSIFKPFADEVTGLLAGLGMENAKIEVNRSGIDPASSGMDEVEILFSANKGVKPQPIRQVASGGEFSRLMFAIKYIMADKMALPTLIFDEIDTGISGEVALQMVKMMQEIALKHQVICISHLPQVAAKGEKHYFVYKDNSTNRTISKIRLLENEERIQEIAKMIAGSNPSATAFENAKELLSL
ncbi:DNA repair protein RecN [Litoribacter ruber]|uniref:DNA repair protein RecN n=1 Tax=Litoribacter ruber TaxID=702568 RepID=UPI001BDA0DBF|nr:DNA repair protein RecN [Litoribacter ruber]MBT0811135.1 DNA repair protein RecN [Litoribacter ruber]